MLKVVATEETTSRPTSQLKTPLSGTGIGRKFSPTPCVSRSWNLLLPSSPAPGFQSTVSFQRFLLQLDHPFIYVFLSSLRAAAGVSSHHPPLEFFLEFLLLRRFEARHPSEELPRFLLLGLEALLLLHACFPEFSISQQLRWPLIHELLSH